MSDDPPAVVEDVDVLVGELEEVAVAGNDPNVDAFLLGQLREVGDDVVGLMTGQLEDRDV